MKLHKLYVAFAYLVCFCVAAAMEKSVDIFRAVRIGNAELVLKLLEGDPGLVNARNEYKETPLHTVSFEGYADIVTLLLDYKANVGAQSNGGWTPLHKSSFWGRTEIAKLLLQHKADVNAQDVDGWTPLYGASRWDHTETAKLLLSYGAIPYSPINLFEEFFRFSTLYAQGHQAFINKVKKERDKVFWILRSIKCKEGGERIMLPAELCDKIVELAFSGIQEWHQFKKAHPNIAALADAQEGKLS